jgi:8-oxo-dGTP pyrophosphatase MutT (NUDIX family)
MFEDSAFRRRACPAVLCGMVWVGCYNITLVILPTGGLDPQRHADLQDCAARELSEEVSLLYCRFVILLFENSVFRRQACRDVLCG